MNVYFKIFTGVFTSKLDKHVSNLISQLQFALICRFSHYNISSFAQVMKLSKEKAWTSTLARRVWMLDQNSSNLPEQPSKTTLARSLLNSSYSSGYQIKSGVRQGDTITPVLFIPVIKRHIRGILIDSNMRGCQISLENILVTFPNLCRCHRFPRGLAWSASFVWNTKKDFNVKK